MCDFWVFALEGVDEDCLSIGLLQRSPSSGTFQSVTIERTRARSNCEFTPNPPQHLLIHPNILLLFKKREPYALQDKASLTYKMGHFYL